MIKRSVSLAIRDFAQPSAVLIVQRPADDEDLPNVWGLPAATLAADESWQDAARRAGRDKLGIDLDIGALLNDGSLDRAAYTLEMRVYEATIRAGLPEVPQRVEGVTQYQRWRWGHDGDLEPAAQMGSLCSRLYLART
jgi:ADP-ribose pyrophosphatase YjhB (NUDIX family)